MRPNCTYLHSRKNVFRKKYGYQQRRKNAHERMVAGRPLQDKRTTMVNAVEWRKKVASVV